MPFERQCNVRCCRIMNEHTNPRFSGTSEAPENRDTGSFMPVAQASEPLDLLENRPPAIRVLIFGDESLPMQFIQGL